MARCNRLKKSWPKALCWVSGLGLGLSFGASGGFWTCILQVWPKRSGCRETNIHEFFVQKTAQADPAHRSGLNARETM